MSGNPVARLGSRTATPTTSGGYPWADGQILYAADLNTAFFPLYGGTLSASNAEISGYVRPGNISIAHGNALGLANVAGMSFDVSNGAFFESGGTPVGVNKVGTTGTAVQFFQAGTPVGSISVTVSATAYNTSSDGRLKEDARPFDAGPILDQVDVWDFAWKADGRRTHGVIAQEMRAVYPDAVTFDPAQDWWGVDYSKFVPLLLAEVKALRERVATLEQAP